MEQIEWGDIRVGDTVRMTYEDPVNGPRVRSIVTYEGVVQNVSRANILLMRDGRDMVVWKPESTVHTKIERDRRPGYYVVTRYEGSSLAVRYWDGDRWWLTEGGEKVNGDRYSVVSRVVQP